MMYLGSMNVFKNINPNSYFTVAMRRGGKFLSVLLAQSGLEAAVVNQAFIVSSGDRNYISSLEVFLQSNLIDLAQVGCEALCQAMTSRNQLGINILLTDGRIDPRQCAGLARAVQIYQERSLYDNEEGKAYSIVRLIEDGRIDFTVPVWRELALRNKVSSSMLVKLETEHRIAREQHEASMRSYPRVCKMLYLTASMAC